MTMLADTDLVDQIARLTQPWASLYNDSPALQTAVTFLHLAGIFLGGGFEGRLAPGRPHRAPGQQ
jgi:hypothetical protein